MTNRTKRNLKRDVTGYLFCAPVLILFGLFLLYPLCLGIYQSFTNYDLFFQMDFVGLDQYRLLLGNSAFRTPFLRSIGNTLLYAVMFIPLLIVISMGLASALNHKFRCNKLFRVLFYIPGLTGAVAAAFVWRWLFNYTYGPINSLLTSLGLPTVDFLGDEKTVMFAFVLMGVWGGLGGTMVMYTAALQGIPGEAIEAAQIDGASKTRIFWTITVPLLAPMTTYLVTMNIISSLQLIDPVLLLAPSNPGAQTPAYIIYQQAFIVRQAGFAAAHAVLLFLLIMLLTFGFRKFNRESFI